jgi:hypothetical protein
MLHLFKSICPDFFQVYLFKDLLGFFGVVPEILLVGYCLFLLYIIQFLFDVKETSSAHQCAFQYPLSARLIPFY